MTKGSVNSHKRKSSLDNLVNPPASKITRCSPEEALFDKMKKPEEYLIRAEKDDENEDKIENEHGGDDGEGEDAEIGNDLQDEAAYLSRDEGPTSTERELEKGFPAEDADEENKSARHFSHGSYLVQGKLDHGMEDYIFAEHRNINGYDLGLYAIFDGHAGRVVAKYLQRHLFERILNEPDFWKNPVRALKRTCKAVDEEILEKIADSRGGSTAVVAILINGVRLLVANVGDSRAILCRNGSAKQITVDHEPQREKDLVESRGGFVTKAPGCVPRVDGVLAMSRAFGDGRLKEHITAEPDVMVQNITEDTEFIILASDGLWKVMTNEEACECIKDMDGAKKAAKKLVKEALVQGSYDDISCIVVMFSTS
ncbi:probable protein phosphatase 2C 39 isoform X1 [Prosopis cineraria]|uniref:probable protein phosphatase 2C 39 isoform X1 n=1 Tax=Prosopis cineraria TaxID=364024 RepID=UPI002410A344|nr:probable protein phosphatase 2C 39 isoform X1 [Prosopis cineraria]